MPINSASTPALRIARRLRRKKRAEGGSVFPEDIRRVHIRPDAPVGADESAVAGNVDYDPMTGVRVGADMERTEQEPMANRFMRGLTKAVGYDLPKSMLYDLPVNMVDHSVQNPLPGLRREDFTDLPPDTTPDPKSAFGGIGVAVPRGGWQPVDPMVGSSLEAAINVMGGTALSGAEEAARGAHVLGMKLGAGPVLRRPAAEWLQGFRSDPAMTSSPIWPKLEAGLDKVAKNKGQLTQTQIDEFMAEEARAAATKPHFNTPEFKEWFGGSRAVDENGLPMTLYHGTPNYEHAAGVIGGGFDTFDRLATSKIIKGRQPGMDSIGSWFSDLPTEKGAGMYAGNGSIYPVHLNVRNPWEPKDFNEFLGRMHEAAGSDLASVRKAGRPAGAVNPEPLREQLLSQGYDGIKFPRGTVDGKEQSVWVALEPNQVKSATGNSGAFSPHNPSILGAGAADRRAAAAAAALDMSQEARLARAQEQGFDTSVPRYHGTSKDKDFKKFNDSRHGTWTTEDADVASDYAKNNDSMGYRRSEAAGAKPWDMEPVNSASRVIPLAAKPLENPYIVRSGHDIPQSVRDGANYKKGQSEWFDELRRAGHDGVIYEKMGVRVDFNNANLRGQFAPYDPANAGKSMILGAGAADKRAAATLWWHGSPSGDLRGGPSGLHLGSKEAAQQALESRIGIPADGKGWDGTRTYGETLLAGQETLRKLDPRGLNLTGYNADAPLHDYYPTKPPTYGDGTPVQLDARPTLSPYQLTGEMSNTPASRHPDFRANGYMAGQLKRGNAKKGYYYENVGEDAGSTSITVPSAAHIKPVTLGAGAADKRAAGVSALDDVNNILTSEQRLTGAPNGPRPTGPAAGPAAAPETGLDVSGGLGGSTGRGAGLEEALRASARWADERSPVEGLPVKPMDIPGYGAFQPGPIGKIHDVAEDYMRTVHPDRPYTPPTKYHPIDPEHSQAIAKAYEEMKHTPNDPATKASYDALIDETAKQYEAIKKTGLKIEPIPAGAPNPYEANPRLAAIDVAENNHLWFFPTEGDFGTVNKITDNPMLRKTGEKIGDHELLANDMFRVVHDYFGHLKQGYGFRAAGEDNAWRMHSQMYSDLARPAMTTETRGQNSWVNYGPHGEKNRTASGADTIYADQKVGLMPEWTMRDRGSLPPIMVYHGSPHYFRRADISKIGTGEGNQAYGHGLYFAGHEPVSEWYRHQLATRSDPLLKKYKLEDVGHVIGSHLSDAGGDAAKLAHEYALLRDKLIAGGETDKATKNMILDYDRRIEYLNNPKRATGHMYQFGIDVPPEKLLDYDASFTNQSQHVQGRVGPEMEASVKHQLEAINRSLDKGGRGDPSSKYFRRFSPTERQNLEGRQLLLEQTGASSLVGKDIYKRMGLPAHNESEASVRASQRLLGMDVPGLRYKDAGSRAPGQQGSHNYVMFGDNTLRLLKQYGVVGIPAAGVLGLDGEERRARGGRVAKRLARKRRAEGGAVEDLEPAGYDPMSGAPIGVSKTAEHNTKRPSWMMEPDLVSSQTGSLPDGVSLDDSGRPAYSDTGEPLQVIRRPNVMPFVSTPDGVQMAMPKILDVATNMGGGWAPKGGGPVFGSGPVLRRIADDTGSAAMRVAREVKPRAKAAPPEAQYPHFAEQYPPTGAGVPTIDPKSGKPYMAKNNTAEAEEFAAARSAIQKDMDANGYKPYFDPAKRFHVDPSKHPAMLDTAQNMPKQREAIKRWTQEFDAPETRAALQRMYKVGQKVPNAENWYMMGQLEREYIRELGPKIGRAKFREDFGGAMAATTGGADPTSNFLMGHYANVQRYKGQDFPRVTAAENQQVKSYAESQGVPYVDKKGRPIDKTGDIASYKLPFPIGGQYASSNLDQYQRIFEEVARGKDIAKALQDANPKRLDFMQSFTGNPNSFTWDKQMTTGATANKLDAPGLGYGVAERVAREEAARAGVPAQNFQDVGWAGQKAMLEGAKPLGGKLQGPTGVHNFKYEGPMISHINDVVERTHRLTGMPREEIVRRGLIRAEIPLYGGAAAMAAPVVADQMRERAAGGAVDAAMDVARSIKRAKGGKVHVGPIVGKTDGRADKVAMEVPDGSYVLTADHCSAMGEGNTLAGFEKLKKMFPKSVSAYKALKAGGPVNRGRVPIYAADGEFVICPEDIRDRWDDLDAGHKVLDHWQTSERQNHIDTLSKLAPPAQD